MVRKKIQPPTNIALTLPFKLLSGVDVTLCAGVLWTTLEPSVFTVAGYALLFL